MFHAFIRDLQSF